MKRSISQGAVISYTVLWCRLLFLFEKAGYFLVNHLCFFYSFAKTQRTLRLGGKEETTNKWGDFEPSILLGN